MYIVLGLVVMFMTLICGQYRIPCLQTVNVQPLHNFFHAAEAPGLLDDSRPAPHAAFLHQSQLISPGDALIASPDALPDPPLPLAVRTIRELALAGSADRHMLLEMNRTMRSFVCFSDAEPGVNK